MTKPKTALPKIKQALFSLLQHKSLSSITTKEICKAASVGRSTFYKYFHDKYEILEIENHLICTIFDQQMAQQFLFLDMKKTLREITQRIEIEHFLQLISIQDGTVNLKAELSHVLEQHFTQYFLQENLQARLKIDLRFAQKLFCEIALTAIIWLIENGIEQADLKFIDQMQQSLLIDLNTSQQ